MTVPLKIIFLYIELLKMISEKDLPVGFWDMILYSYTFSLGDCQRAHLLPNPIFELS